MHKTLKYILPFFIIVVIDPYKNLDYNKINVYDFREEFTEEDYYLYDFETYGHDYDYEYYSYLLDIYEFDD